MAVTKSKKTQQTASGIYRQFLNGEDEIAARNAGQNSLSNEGIVNESQGHPLSQEQADALEACLDRGDITAAMFEAKLAACNGYFSKLELYEKVAERKAALDAINNEWADFQDKFVKLRDDISSRRRQAMNNLSAAQNAASEAVAIFREHPDLEEPLKAAGKKFLAEKTA